MNIPLPVSATSKADVLSDSLRPGRIDAVTTPNHSLPAAPRELPANVLEVKTVPWPAGPGGMFSVDPERAQACIDGLRKVVLDLSDAARALDQAYFPPPAQDAVSVNLAVQGGIMAQRAQTYALAWRDQIDQTARALEEQLAAYRAADGANAHRLT